MWCQGQQPAALERAARMRVNGAELELPASHASDESATRLTGGSAPTPGIVEQLEDLVLGAWPLEPPPAAEARPTPAPRSRRLMRSNHLRVTP